MQKLIILGLMIFVASCASTIPSKDKSEPLGASAVAIQQICEPIYGLETDWDIISDELARNIYKHNKMCERL